MAGRIPESFIDEVRSSVNIVDLISQYVSLEKKGKDYIGLCPFHQEKTPSFTVSENKQFFKCFGCGKGGNVFNYVMYQEHLTFPESVKFVAQFAHITMPVGIGFDTKPLSPLKKIYQESTEFYQHILISTKAGDIALKYAKNRNLSDDLLNHFKIGYAPQNDTILLTFLKQKGYDQELLKKSGLFVESKDGKLYDRFRDRLMFPLDDESGNTVGFSGRRISDDPEIAKYLNSPETEIFTKSKVLFHFSEAKKAAKLENHLILYEGYMDVIAAYKAGIRSGIASMGTSLTQQQVYMLRRITPNIIINYDGDEPGIHAAERAINIFNEIGSFNLGIVVLPENLDPDDFVKKYGEKKYKTEVNGALTPTEFLLDRFAQKYNLHNDREKLAYLNDGIHLISLENDPVAQDLYIKKLANKTDVTVESLKVNLLRELRKNRKANDHKKQLVHQDIPISSDNSIENIRTSEINENPIYQRLLFLFLHSEEARNYLLEKHFLFPDERYANLMELWLKYQKDSNNASIHGFIDFVPEEFQGIIVNMEMSDWPDDYSKKELDDQLHSLEVEKVNNQIFNLLDQIKTAQQKNDNQTILELTQKLISLKRQKI